MLKAVAGLGLAAAIPTACGNDDVDVFAGALTDPVRSSPNTPTSTAVPAPVPTTPPITEPTETPSAASSEVAAEPTATAAPTPSPIPLVAVAGEMVISFTYTQGPTGKNERPYVAVWIEDEAGELVDTIALFYQLERRGERWLDHLTRWYEVDQARISTTGIDDAATVSSATRQPGTYAVAWDGTINGMTAPPGLYYICIEAAREEGPYSLIREPFNLAGALASTALPDDGELSAATARIDV